MKAFAIVSVLCSMVVLSAGTKVAGQQDAIAGLRYWLPVDILVLDVKVTTKKTTEYVPTQTAEGGRLEKRTTIAATREGTVATRTLADHAVTEQYSLDALSGRLAEAGFTVQVSSGGLLQSVNPSSKGRGPELLTAVAKFIGTAASAFTGGLFGSLKLDLASREHLKNTYTLMAQRHGLKSVPESGFGAAPQECDPFAAPISTQPIRVRAMLAKNQLACSLFWQIQERNDALEDFSAQRLKLEGQLEGTTKPEELKDLREKITDRTKAINATTTELVALQARLLALLDAFVIDEGLGVSTTSEQFATTLNLTDLVESLEKLPDGQKQLFAATGIVVLGSRLAGEDPVSATTVDAKPPAPPVGETDKQRKEREKKEAEAKKAAAAAREKTFTIAFRQARPWRLEVRASRCSELRPEDNPRHSAPCRKDDKPDVPTSVNTELKTAHVVDLVAAKAPTSSLTFTTAAFSDKSLSVVFDDKGRPTQLQRTGGSSLAGLASAIAGASTAARDEYAAGLAKIIDIQSSRQKLALQDVNNEIERLQKEKALIDAKVQTASATQSFDLLLQQNQLNANLSLLKVKLDSESAQNTYDRALELAALRADLDKLKMELDILKAKQEITAIEDAKKGGGQ